MTVSLITAAVQWKNKELNTNYTHSLVQYVLDEEQE